jgi:hypothetical protein
MRRIVDETLGILSSVQAGQSSPPLWDGHTAERIVSILKEQLAD